MLLSGRKGGAVLRLLRPSRPFFLIKRNKMEWKRIFKRILELFDVALYGLLVGSMIYLFFFFLITCIVFWAYVISLPEFSDISDTIMSMINIVRITLLVFTTSIFCYIIKLSFKKDKEKKE